ncbi:hypothetical protein, partial [Plasmodium yoelii yoelii]
FFSSRNIWTQNNRPRVFLMPPHKQRD